MIEAITIRELKEIINSFPEEILDNKIVVSSEEVGVTGIIGISKVTEAVRNVLEDVIVSEDQLREQGYTEEQISEMPIILDVDDLVFLI